MLEAERIFPRGTYRLFFTSANYRFCELLHNEALPHLQLLLPSMRKDIFLDTPNLKVEKCGFASKQKRCHFKGVSFKDFESSG